jgi:hypothetical protein
MEELMNDQSNAPMSAGSDGIAGWFSVWITAVTKPNEQTYATLAEHPDAQTNNRAFLWVFLAGTISALISGVFQAILGLAGFTAAAGMGDLFGVGAQRGVVAGLGIAICSSPVIGAIATLGFAIGVGIIQWIAKMFKGTGTFSRMAYTMAAVTVPFTLISALLTPFSVIPFVGLCTSGISILLGLYVLVLEIMAVKGVNKFGWGEAAGSVLLPGLVLVCCAVVVITGMTTLGLAVGDTFDSINPSLP